MVDGSIVYFGPRLDADGGDCRDRAENVIDVTGLVVAPGFIDIHTHSDLSLVHDPAAESKLLQGVTTEVVGNCGFSAFPSSGPTREALLDHLARLGPGPAPICWDDFDGYAGAVAETPPAVNVASLVGHGALRIAAMADPFAPATTSDIEKMAELLSTALSQGAWGLSTGLTHTPSSLAHEDEVERLASVCGAHGALYATHARVLAGHSLAAMEEAVRTSRRSGARLQYSHLALHEPADWGATADALAIFDRATAEGLDVGFDVYPYDASSSDLMQYLPPWAQAGGSAQLAKSNEDPAWRGRALDEIRQGWFGGIPWLWDRVVITAAGPDADVVGLSIDQISRRRQVPPEEVLLDLCVEAGSQANAVLHYRMERDMVDFLRHPLSIVGSDGLAVSLSPAADKPHPRGFGTFPRVLGRYVRERQELSLVDAIHKMTEAPARRLGLRGRGTIGVGQAADVVAFDPDRVIDQATFLEPRQAPVGIEHVLVNGSLAVEHGQATQRFAGRSLRRH
jgi:N-acyl-D-aspartate/D-glutamate deacylase